MKTVLIYASFVFAATLPVTFIAEFIGIHFPSTLNSANVFLAFVTVLVLLITFSDYRQMAPTKHLVTLAPPAAGKADHALAA